MESGSINALLEPPQQPGLQPGRAGTWGSRSSGDEEREKDERRQILPSMLRPGLAPARPVRERCLQHLPAVPGGDTLGAGAAAAPPGKRGPRGQRRSSLTTHGPPSLQQALIAEGQLKASGGR